MRSFGVSPFDYQRLSKPRLPNLELKRSSLCRSLGLARAKKSVGVAFNLQSSPAPVARRLPEPGNCNPAFDLPRAFANPFIFRNLVVVSGAECVAWLGQTGEGRSARTWFSGLANQWLEFFALSSRKGWQAACNG